MKNLGKSFFISIFGIFILQGADQSFNTKVPFIVVSEDGLRDYAVCIHCPDGILTVAHNKLQVFDYFRNAPGTNKASDLCPVSCKVLEKAIVVGNGLISVRNASLASLIAAAGILKIREKNIKKAIVEKLSSEFFKTHLNNKNYSCFDGKKCVLGNYMSHYGYKFLNQQLPPLPLELTLREEDKERFWPGIWRAVITW